VIPEALSLFRSHSAYGTESDSNAVSKLVRQLRVLRALRSFKMISKFSTLKVIVTTILTTFGSIGNIMLLLFLLMYIYGVVACSIFAEFTSNALAEAAAQSGATTTTTTTTTVAPEKFARLDQAFVSLFQLLTLDQWHATYTVLLEKSGLPSAVTTVFIVSWVWLGAFVFRNIFVGVIVNGFQTAKHSKQLDDAPDKSTSFDPAMAAARKQATAGRGAHAEECGEGEGEGEGGFASRDDAWWLAQVEQWSDAAEPDQATIAKLFQQLPAMVPARPPARLSACLPACQGVRGAVFPHCVPPRPCVGSLYLACAR
jgi:hypothetical protein